MARITRAFDNAAFDVAAFDVELFTDPPVVTPPPGPAVDIWTARLQQAEAWVARAIQPESWAAQTVARSVGTVFQSNIFQGNVFQTVGGNVWTARTKQTEVWTAI